MNFVVYQLHLLGFDNHTKVIVGTAVAVGTITAAGLAYLYAKNRDDPIPTKWKKVGQIIDLNCFPLKSGAPIKRNTFDCQILGFEYETLFDRCLVVSQNNKQVTARTYPKMILIQPTVVNEQLTLSAPGQSDITLDLNELRKKPVKSKVQLWDSKVLGIDAGDDVANWLSEYIVKIPNVFRLIYYPYEYPTKPKLSMDKQYNYNAKDVGVYHDATSYMLINQGSVDELNSHLDHVTKPLQFRPNIVVKGPNAYEEDNWQWIRFGENVVFRGVRPCTRCIFTTINPETAERNPQREPLETLKKNRTIIPNESPVMGLHLAVRAPGMISIGDAVYINDDSEV